MKIINSAKMHGLIKRINEALDPALEKRLRKDLKKYCEETGNDYEGICKLAGLNTRGFEALSSDIVEFMDKKVSGEWIFDDKTGRINVEGNLQINTSGWGEYSEKSDMIPVLKKIQFGKINGNFALNGLDIKNDILEYLCPLEVDGEYNISNNDLTKAILPPKITGGIKMDNNLIESLEGCPEKVDGEFNIRNNNLKSLKGGPIEVNGDYNCASQKNLQINKFDLTGCAKIIKGKFLCSANNLNSLEGGPVEVEYGMDLSNNNLLDLKGNFKIVNGSINVDDNELASLEGLPLSVRSSSVSCKKNKMQARVMKDTFNDARTLKSWIAAYLKLAATQRFKRMGKSERDPIVAKITPEILAKNPVALAPIWKDEELLNDPVIKRRIKQSGVTKDEAFKKDVELISDLGELGF